MADVLKPRISQKQAAPQREEYYEKPESYDVEAAQKKETTSQFSEYFKSHRILVIAIAIIVVVLVSILGYIFIRTDLFSKIGLSSKDQVVPPKKEQKTIKPAPQQEAVNEQEQPEKMENKPEQPKPSVAKPEEKPEMKDHTTIVNTTTDEEIDKYLN